MAHLQRKYPFFAVLSAAVLLLVLLLCSHSPYVSGRTTTRSRMAGASGGNSASSGSASSYDGASSVYVPENVHASTNGAAIDDGGQGRGATSTAAKSRGVDDNATPPPSYNYDDLLSTREEILATREHRKKRLEQMIHDVEHELQQDLIGRRMLAQSERFSMERRLTAYRRKLETLQGELDDRVSFSQKV